MSMKRSGIYVPKKVYECWEVYARFRGGRMSRNNVLEELTYYSLCPHLLDVRPEIIAKAIQDTQDEMRRRDPEQVSEGNW